FQQADGTTSRKYGGTGLGLSISREIANLLGGELKVQSTPGQGSTFTLLVPLDGPETLGLQHSPAAVEPSLAGEEAGDEPEQGDDRNAIQPGDKVILIVEDDPTFGRVLLDVARSAGLKGVLSGAGAGTLALARKTMPDAITLDLGLSDIDGWVLFDLLQHDPKTASIPIHVISGAEDAAELTAKGAASAMLKPVDPQQLTSVFSAVAAASDKAVRPPASANDSGPFGAPDLAGAKVLIIDDDIRNIYSLTSMLETCGIEVLHAESGREGIAILEQNPDTHIALVDIMMPEMDGYETMRTIRGRPALAHIPLISVTAKAMKGDRQKCLDAGASDYIAKPVDLDLLLALLRVWVARSRERSAALGMTATTA
ncbi:MAG: signal transduction histidine kinase, partial [Devosia sp.]|nr:signal transduction histidine kinase [Devosia sp.]